MIPLWLALGCAALAVAFVLAVARLVHRPDGDRHAPGAPFAATMPHVRRLPRAVGDAPGRRLPFDQDAEA